jgi:CRP-like cAMP-binding protein
MATAAISSQAFSAGEIIFSEGDTGFALYVIRSGKVLITSKTASAKKVIATLGPGELVGEMAVASGARRCATATAAVDCVLTVLPKEVIDQRLEAADPILKILLLTAFERLRVLSVRADDYALKS